MSRGETIREVRALTGFGGETISEGQFYNLIRRAEKELSADVGREPDYETDVTADTARFWLLALFSKIHVGDIATGSFSVGEIQTQSLADNEAQMWLDKYHARRDQLVGSDGFGHVQSTRREYGDDR